MSNFSNDNIMERASEMIDMWEGTPLARALEADIDRNDLEALYTHVCVAEAMQSQEEMHSSNIL